MPWLILLLLLLPYFAFASTRVVSACRKFYDNRLHGRRSLSRGGLLIALLLLPYLFAALPEARENPAEFAGGLVRMMAYLFIPGLALLYRPAGRRPLDLFDLTAIIALWFPIEFDWLPDVPVQLLPGLSLPLPKLIGVDLAFLLFLVIRPAEGLGYSFRFTRNDVLRAVQAFGAFAVVGLPLGFAIRFIGLQPAPFDFGKWALSFAGIYFLIGIPEELLFRGIIQNLIEQRWGRSWITLAAASLVFGAAHLNNATTSYPAPNFAYMLMAALAGAAYGWAWQKSGKITSAALTHTLVDWVWGVILGG
jgi:membrane protease YdiL (CAAX protease family)